MIDVYLPGAWGCYQCAFSTTTWNGVFQGLGNAAKNIWLVKWDAQYGVTRVYARRLGGQR